MIFNLENPPHRFRCECLVIGAGPRGVALARAFRQAGRDVLVAERRTYPGGETISANRLWIDPAERKALDRLLAPASGWVVDPAGADHGALWPDAYKRALEDVLIDSGSRLLYHVRPVRWERSGAVHRVIFAGKNGCVLVEAALVADTTRDGVLAQLDPRCTERPDGGVISQTLEFTNTREIFGGGASIDHEHAGVRYRFYPGGHPDGHVLVDCRWQGAAGLAARRSRAWQTALRLGAKERLVHLRSTFPGLLAGRLGSIAREPWLAPARRAAGGGAPGPLAPFVTGEGLLVFSGSADLGDDEAMRLEEDLPLQLQLAEQLAALTPVGGGVDFARELPRETVQVDVLVVGGGTSGGAAAVAAAEAGARTLLVEMNSALGGTTTSGGINSHWLGRPVGYNQRVLRRIEEIDEDPYSPFASSQWNVESRAAAMLGLAHEAGVDVALGTCPVAVTVEGGRLARALCATGDHLLEIKAAVTVDATGDGDVAVAAGAPWVYGSGRECITMWYAFLPCPRPGTMRSNFHSLVYVGDPEDYTRAILSARRRLPGYDHATYLAPRETRHIKGRDTLTLEDQLLLRRRPDVINLAFGNYDIKGHSVSAWVRFGLIPPQAMIEIPYGALVPQGVHSLLVTGKAISASNVSLPSWRMQADVENLGYGTGLAAARAALAGIEPADLDVRALQGELVRHSILPPEILDRPLTPAPDEDANTLAAHVAALDDSVSLRSYQHQKPHEVATEVIPFVRVCLAPPGIEPLLVGALSDPSRKGRKLAAMALAWRGHPGGADLLHAAILAELEGAPPARLPGRHPLTLHAHEDPDHGAMSELANLLHAFARTRDPRGAALIETVAARLDLEDARFRDRKTGVFYYLDAIGDVAERLATPACAPTLSKLLAHPLLDDTVLRAPHQPDYFRERQAYTALVLSRALARCGVRAGYERLLAFTEDRRRPLREHACNELRALIGDAEPRPERWRAWVLRQTQFRSRAWNEKDDPFAAILPNI